VQQKNPSLYAAKKDSASYYYAGYSKDIKNVFGAMNMRYTDSVAQNDWTSVFSNNYQPVMKATTIRKQVMPNVRGMGLKDALYLLENMGVKVAVRGKGKINNQSIAPGTALPKGITVMLELS
jgi:cell division protein FtsI (penicillin-binding protein 3)